MVTDEDKDTETEREREREREKQKDRGEEAGKQEGTTTCRIGWRMWDETVASTRSTGEISNIVHQLHTHYSSISSKKDVMDTSSQHAYQFARDGATTTYHNHRQQAQEQMQLSKQRGQPLSSNKEMHGREQSVHIRYMHAYLCIYIYTVIHI